MYQASSIDQEGTTMDLTAYVRVSTGKQAKEDRLGKPVQIKAIGDYARDNGHRIVEWRYDDGVSGGNELDCREGLPIALADVKDGTSKGIIVYRLDRLARDLIIQETLLAEIRKMGGKAFTTSLAESEYVEDDPKDPSRKLIRQVLGAVNEYEKSMISLRLRSGRKMKADQGRYAYGSPAYGQMAKDRELVANESEQAVIAKMRELRDQGMSYATIADTLNGEGIKPKRGNQWHSMTVSRALSRQ
jgi:DNA invertase Pin-like site-specific DNA recombinase